MGRAGKQPASQRVFAALIGCGSRGLALLAIDKDTRCSIVAVCDVDQKQVAKAKERVGNAAACTDFRRILDRSDIDAVLIATPDHWHGPMTVMACQAGKDVYCEKPLARSIGEGRRMVEAARRYDRVVQVGSQYRSNTRTRQACHWVRNGRLGRVHTIRLTHPPNCFHPCEPPRPVPPELDWNFWLGPAPWAAYHPLRCHFTFRWFMDYGGGSLADNGVHMFNVVSWAMGTDHTGPRWIEASGRLQPGNIYDCPVELTVRYRSDEPPFELVWEQRQGLKLNIEFVGTKATLSGFWSFKLTRGEADLSPPKRGEIELERSESHSGNWLECIFARRRPVLDVDTGHRVTTWSHLGNIAYQLGRKVEWDPARERFVADQQANRLLEVAYRQPWQI